MLLQYFNKGFLRTALLVLYIRPMFSLKLHLNHFYANSFLPPLPSPFPLPHSLHGQKVTNTTFLCWSSYYCKSLIAGVG